MPCWLTRSSHGISIKLKESNTSAFKTSKLMKKLLLFIFCQLLFSCSHINRLETARTNPSTAVELDLSASKLLKMPPEISQMNNLRELVLFRNKIDSVPSFIGDLTKLEELSLQSNRLVYVPDEIGDLVKLKKLNLRFNRLKVLPEGLGNLSALEELDLRNNLLTALPQNIGELMALEYLYLSDNHLKSLPESFRKLKKLRLLHLGRNHLEGPVPEFIGDLEDLIELDVSGCGDDNQLPSSIAKLRRLETLYVSSYQIIPYEIGRGNPRLKIIVK